METTGRYPIPNDPGNLNPAGSSTRPMPEPRVITQAGENIAPRDSATNGSTYNSNSTPAHPAPIDAEVVTSTRGAGSPHNPPRQWNPSEHVHPAQQGTGSDLKPVR
jgi:hypothetical protein